MMQSHDVSRKQGTAAHQNATPSFADTTINTSEVTESTIQGEVREVVASFRQVGVEMR